MKTWTVGAARASESAYAQKVDTLMCVLAVLVVLCGLVYFADEIGFLPYFLAMV